jgi:hypothetical protein
VAALVFIAFIRRDDVDPYRLNFLYFSTLYAFWIGLFGSCQAVNSEVRSGEWCYWVLGMGRNRTVHVFAIGASCLAFAAVQCLVFLVCVVSLSGLFPGPGSEGLVNHFTDMFVSVPAGKASPDPVYQMNGTLWFVLSARWGKLGPVLFATGIFSLSLGAALVSGTSFGLLFGALFRDPATSLNIAVGFVVLLGMVSFCGLRGDGNGTEKVGDRFAPLRVRSAMDRGTSAGDAVPAALLSYVLPQRYFFNLGQLTFEKEWSDEDKVQEKLRSRHAAKTEDDGRDGRFRFKGKWTETNARVWLNCTTQILPWINGWNESDLVQTDGELVKTWDDWSQPKPDEMVAFLRRHPRHRAGWKVARHRKALAEVVLPELAALLALDLAAVLGALLAVWKKPCYQRLR